MNDLRHSQGADILPKNAAKLVVLALVFLFNPSFNLIDLLPDFISYFILARVFDKAADCAPYFEEARRDFIRLGYLCMAKIPALLIIVSVRTGNVADNDIIALFCLVFATVEIILLIPAVNHIFAALTYLGERSRAESLLSSDSEVSVDDLRSFTLAFSVFKCLLYFVPELTRITRSVELESGIYVKSGSRYYPWMILGSLIIGLVIGSVWLSRMMKLVRRVRSEGKLSEALLSVASASSIAEYEKKRERRALSRTFVMFVIASVLLINLSFSNLYSVDLLPSFLFTTFFTVALIRLTKAAKLSQRFTRAATVGGVSYTVVALVSSAVSFIFLTKYGYDQLYEGTRPEAVALYRAYGFVSIAGLLLHTLLGVMFFTVMRRYLTSPLASVADGNSRRMDASYRTYLNKRTIAYTVLFLLVGALELAVVFSKGNVELIFTNPHNVTDPTIIASSLPWLPTLKLAVNVIFVFYSVYYFNFVKEEMRI